MLYAFLVFATTLTGTLLIPALRPFFAAFHPGHEAAMHAFMSVNMLGAAFGSPIVTVFADRSGRRSRLAAMLLGIDGVAMAIAAVSPSIPLVLFARVIEGAASVGALSIIMGAFRSKRQGRAMGVASASVVAAIACGAPLGTLFVRIGPRAALWASVCISFVAALLVSRLADTAPAVKERGPFWSGIEKPGRKELILAALFVGLERFAVGSFIVTFQIYAHSALGKTDSQVGMLFTAFLVPFALGSVLVGMLLGKGVSRAALLLGGGVLYGALVAMFGQTDGAALWVTMVLAGVASAAIYAPSLYVAAGAVPEALRSTAMGLVNASGTLGMMLGTALAGVLSLQLIARGMDPNDARRMVFLLSGGFVALAFAIGGLALSFSRKTSQS
jgi:MFS family permease